MKIAFALLVVILWPRLASSQEFQHQFQERPHPEANLIVIWHKLVSEPEGFYLEGRIFNRGIKPAKNVRVVYSLRKSGAQLPSNPIYLSEVPPTSYADFRERLTGISDTSDLFITVRAEWNNE